MLSRLVGDDAGQHARHVDRHVPRPVQPHAARASPRREPAAALPDPRHAGPARADQAAVQGAQHRRRALTRRGSCSTSSPAPRRRACARTRSRPATSSRGGRSSTTRSTTRCASAKAWSTSPSCCCEATSSSRSTTACASITGAASRTSSSTSSRTRTCCSTSGCKLLAGRAHARCSPSATTTSRSTRSAARNVANMQHFERDFAREACRSSSSSSSRTTARTATSSTPPTRSSSTTRRGSARTCGRATARASRCARSRRRRDLDEAAFVVDVTKGLRGGGRRAVARSRVLYRSNAQSRVLEHALFNAAIPYRVYGGMRFFERAEVKHALAYLRLIADARSTTARSCASSIFRRAASARARSRRCRTRRARQGTSLWQVACAGGKVSGKAGASLAAFVRLIEAMRAATAGAAVARGGRARDRGVRACRRTTGPRRTARTASRTWTSSSTPRESFVREADLAVDAPMLAPGERRRRDGGRHDGATDPLDGVSRACRARGRRNAGGRGPAGAAAHDRALGEGARVPHGVRHGPRGGPLPAREQPATKSTASRRSAGSCTSPITRARRRLYLSHAQSRMLHGQIALQHRVALPRPSCRASSSTGCRRRIAARHRGRHRPGGMGRARAAITPRSRPQRARRPTLARMAHRAERAPREVRRGHHHRCRGPRRRRARAGQLPRRRRQVAGARIREARGGVAQLRRPAPAPSFEQGRALAGGFGSGAALARVKDVAVARCSRRSSAPPRTGTHKARR